MCGLNLGLQGCVLLVACVGESIGNFFDYSNVPPSPHINTETIHTTFDKLTFLRYQILTKCKRDHVKVPNKLSFNECTLIP